MTTPVPANRQSSWRRELLAILVMSLAVVCVYWPFPPEGTTQWMADVDNLHVRRMHFAQEAIFGPEHRLPAWYPGEFLGAPFWSNVQSFPFIPTRLFVLLFDVEGPYAFPVAINLAAILTATFTYFYCRRIGMGMIGSATAGWTFACCGYFSSRIGVGHLPLLEAFCGLPLLLWLTESLIQEQQSNRSIVRWIIALTLCTACVLLAGHPQLPIYALATTALYSLWRGGLDKSRTVLISMVLGAGCACFALLPMAMLVGRSTRILSLAPASNDLAMPYRRLAGFFLPWLDGAPPPMARATIQTFQGYPSILYFWDTFVYVGWAPWIAVGFLFLLRILPSHRLRLTPVRLFVVTIGIAGLALSLPIAQQVMSILPGTLLRSPARLLYLTEFSLALAMGGAVHLLMNTQLGRWTRWLVPFILIFHGWSLWSVDREFLIFLPAPLDQDTRAIAQITESVGDGRAGVDLSLPAQIVALHDDIGIFDAIILARTYRLILDLNGLSTSLNTESFNGIQFTQRALELAGVKFVISLGQRSDLPLVAQVNGINIFQTSRPAQRAEFFASDHIQYLEPAEIHERLRNPQIDLHTTLLLPRSYETPLSQKAVESKTPTVQYRRPDSDHIECDVTTAQSGYLRIVESWDYGWTATVDGFPTAPIPALDALLAVPIGSGTHSVKMVYHTPGAVPGLLMSGVSLALLSGWVALTRRTRRHSKIN